MRAQDGGDLVQRPLAEPITDLNCCKGFGLIYPIVCFNEMLMTSARS